MYEAEVNRLIEPIEVIPAEVVRQFTELSGKMTSRTLLPWGEHCTECAWPTCYSSCELYTRREDGACRLFIDGMVRLDYEGGPQPYLLKIRFKEWGKLWTVGNVRLFDPAEVTRREKANIRTGAVARGLPLPTSLRERVLQKVAYRRRMEAEAPSPAERLPDYFVIECYNPNGRTINLTLTIRLRDDKTQRPFVKIVEVQPGFTRAMVKVSEITGTLDLGRPFEIEIVPNDSDDTTLVFGMLDFMKMAVEPQRSAPDKGSKGNEKKWKCIVWDLDNTLWDGTLIEDGQEKIRLRQDIVEIIKEADRRGILHSIASKNNHEDAMKVLRMCGLEEYFLHPQIHWNPKSQSIARIAEQLNIGVDSLVFIDDQPFEREEVKASLPSVATIDTALCRDLLNRSECLVPVTDESKNRRSMYREQEQRKNILNTFNGDYEAFLRECNIELILSPLTSENLERVYELAQRTNQMNFSGNRYPREDLKKLMEASGYETFVMRCADRFGNYGIVGFSVVRTTEPRLLDLMFSCRIQGKRVEHAFLSFLLDRYFGSGSAEFFANYKKTPKNLPSGKVFDDMGFELIEEKDGVTSLAFRYSRAIPAEKVINIKCDALGQPAGAL